jgi:hypothetical protein
MLFALLFFGELLFLFLLSRQLTRSLSTLIYRITRSEKTMIYVLAILFLPGTLIHELSHYLMAMLLFVHAEGLEVMPKMQEHGVKLGSVGISRCDPFRRLLIGMSPFLFGTGILLGILYAMSVNQSFSQFWIVLLVGYVVFEIGNTMFSSRKDMEGALELLIGSLVVVAFLYVIGVRIPHLPIDVFFAQPGVQTLFQSGCVFLLVPILLDIAVIGSLKFFQR